MRAFTRAGPHHVIRNFLGGAMAERFLAFASAREADFQQAGVGLPERRLDTAVRRSRLLPDLGELREPLEARLRAALPGAAAALRVSAFALGSIETQLVAHEHGSFYSRHTDLKTGPAETRNQRILTGVYYFHALPRKFSGGALRLHPILGGGHIDIDPECDSLLLFPAWMPHEVLPVFCEDGKFSDVRFSINCWFRT